MNLNTPESAEMAGHAFKKREVAEQKLSASLKCVIDMLVKQSNGMPAEAKQVGLKADQAWKAFDNAHWNFFELMEEDEAEAEEMEASYEKLMGKAAAIAKDARKNVEEEEQGHLKESTMQFDVIEEKLVKQDGKKECLAKLLKATALRIEDTLEEMMEVESTRIKFWQVLDVLNNAEDEERASGKKQAELGQLSIRRFKQIAMLKFGNAIKKMNAEKFQEELRRSTVKPAQVESPPEAQAEVKLMPTVKGEEVIGYTDNLEEVEKDCHESVPLHIDKQNMVEVEMSVSKLKEEKINIKAAQEESSQDAKAGSRLAPIVKDEVQASRRSKPEVKMMNIVEEKAEVSKKEKQRTEEEKLLRLNQVEMLCLWLLVMLWPPDEVKLKECLIKQAVILKEESLNLKEEVLHELTPLEMDRLLPPARLIPERAMLLCSEYPFEQYCQG